MVHVCRRHQPKSALLERWSSTQIGALRSHPCATRCCCMSRSELQGRRIHSSTCSATTHATVGDHPCTTGSAACHRRSSIEDASTPHLALPQRTQLLKTHPCAARQLASATPVRPVEP
ncbi:hypothetical protein HN51_061896 [Arachis hypogaea]